MALDRFVAMTVAVVAAMAVLPLTAAQDFKQVGCFVDDTVDRVFAGFTDPDPEDMTKRVCAARCVSYPYYGLEYGVECWCGSYAEDDYDKYGESSDCTTPCSGNDNVSCGGEYAIRVFTQAKADPAAEACVQDMGDQRVFQATYTDKTGLTPEACIAYCSSLGSYYAGTQWGEECWCGHQYADLDLHGYGSCTRPCSGDPTKFCGGLYEMTVYKTGVEPICVQDDSESRLFTSGMTVTEGLTTDTCIAYCSSQGYYYAGTQWGSECWCGAGDSAYDTYGPGTCDYPCSGDDSQTCGGDYSMNVYPTGVTSASTTPTTPTNSTGTPTTSLSPTPLMTIPTSCDTDVRPSFRYAASSGIAGRLYAEGEGCFTMTDLYNFRGTESSGGAVVSKGPVYQLDDMNDVYPGLVGEPVTNKWLIASELYITGGAIFYCRGSDIGGDCDELRIQSTGSSDFHTIRGHGGSLYFENTIVTSWDTPNKTPQTVHEGGRSFLNCVSEKLTDETCEGAAKNEMGECRMDIINSEMGYMGWFDSESYGLTWKVRGFCQDLSNPEVFETTNVYGDIIGSDIHHMYYGHYSYGHQGGVWVNNKMHDNWQYGFDPHDDSDYLTIANNEVYNNVNHGIIASKRCNNVKIYDNVVYGGGAQAAGIFLHRSSDFAEVYNNQIYNMQDAGIAMLEAFSADIHDNMIDGVRYGIRMSLGSANNMVYDNTFNDCTDYGLYTYEGSDAPTVDSGRPYDNIFENNQITDTPVGVKFKNSDGIVVTGNEFTGTVELEFNDAQGTEWSGNIIPEGVCVDNVSSDDGNSVDESTFTGSSDGLPSAACEG